MKISEIMTRNVRTLPCDIPVTEALKTILSQEISGLPVLDSSGKVAGMFTEKDVIRSILPSYVSQVGKFVYENSPKAVTSKIAQLSELKVKDLMRHEVVKMTEDTPVYEAARIMLTQNVRRIPVVDKDEKLVGIVARSDILEAVLKA